MSEPDAESGPTGRKLAFTGPVHPVIGGDARCASVAAASVLAKVVRDRLMREESEHFPAYAFEQNKGYPSPDAPDGAPRLRAVVHPPPELVLCGRPPLARQLGATPVETTA